MHPIDVAIIGVACRFPGAADPREFWRLLCEGVEATRLPDDAVDFDADFFNVSPREAAAMDPRQRMALELTWELLEDAFIVPHEVRGERVAVYLGATTDDYAILTLRDTADNLDHHSFAGISRAMIANRISYAFGLEGPSLTVDSGQSSSLVAVHLAAESLRAGQSSLAIAGGIQLNLSEETARVEQEFGAVSASGRTYAFDARADGYVRGEGAGLVLLKPLADAVADGDRIRAVVRGSAIGNAGHRGAGLTVPSVSAEAEVIRGALASAGLDAEQIGYVEAHGTGTAVGDPIEATALGEIFARRQGDPVLVGSVKTNIGHPGAAAGIAGLLKTVLAVENAMIPPSLHHLGPNPEISLEKLGLQVNTELAPWPPGTPRRAGVSSFGMGGTNAHVIVEQAPPEPAGPLPPDPAEVVPWVLSARSAEALTNQADRLLTYLHERPDLAAADVGWSLAARSVFDHRAALVGDRDRLLAGLAELAARQPAALTDRARPAGRIAFLFPGQGAQWLGMGRQLYERFPVFAAAFDAVVAALDVHLRRPLREVLWGADPAQLESTEFAQPALFAVEVALAALWGHWGVIPDLVIGHSVGEITAAHVAGVLTLDDAARVVAARARLMAELPTGGAMVAVAASEDEVTPILAPGVSIAAVNAPDAVVISGPGPEVDRVADRVAEWGRRVHRLAVSHAFHSALMEPMLPSFGLEIAGVEPHNPRMALLSNVTGQQAAAGYGSATYWVEHVSRPVRFAQSISAAVASGVGLFVEVGPGSALSAAVEQGLSVVAMPKGQAEVESLLRAAGQLFCGGADVEWPDVITNGRRVGLPTYGFARKRYWLSAGHVADNPVTALESAGLLRDLNPDELHRQLLQLVRSHAAAVLGHSGGRDVDADRAFQDLGFDSLTGVELRNRLSGDTGLALSRTLVFDYPTPLALADHLGRLLLGNARAESDDAHTWQILRKIPIEELRRTGLLERLLLMVGEREKPHREAILSDDLIDSLTPDALIAMALESSDDDDAAEGDH